MRQGAVVSIETRHRPTCSADRMQTGPRSMSGAPSAFGSLYFFVYFFSAALIM